MRTVLLALLFQLCLGQLQSQILRQVVDLPAPVDAKVKLEAFTHVGRQTATCVVWADRIAQILEFSGDSLIPGRIELDAAKVFGKYRKTEDMYPHRLMRSDSGFVAFYRAVALKPNYFADYSFATGLWSGVEELRMSRGEIELTSTEQNGVLYLVTSSDKESAFVVYRKQWGKPVQRRVVPVDFSWAKNAGMVSDVNMFNSMKTAFQLYYDVYPINAGTYRSHVVSDFSELWTDIYTTVYPHGIAYLVNTGHHYGVYFFVPFEETGVAKSSLIDIRNATLNRQKEQFGELSKADIGGTLGIFFRTVRMNILDSTVVVAKVIKDNLAVLYYDAYSGILRKAEVFDREDAPERYEGRVVDGSYFQFSKFRNTYPYTRFFDLLPTASPLVHAVRLTDTTALIAVDAMEKTRHADAMEIDMQLFAREGITEVSKNWKYLSFARVMDTRTWQEVGSGFPPIPTQDTMLQVNDYIKKQIAPVAWGLFDLGEKRYRAAVDSSGRKLYVYEVPWLKLPGR